MESYKRTGELVAVEIDGEMIRRLSTRIFDDTPLSYQEYQERVLNKVSALQGHPETLV